MTAQSEHTHTQVSEDNMLRQLDRLLRGELTRPDALRAGTFQVSVERLALAVLLLGMIYGACMGCYALFDSHGASVPQFLVTVGKVPLLFVLTVLVTFPSLYVFNALVGSNLSLLATARLVAAAIAVMLAILASLGPIVAFFSLSTTGYNFMLLLNVAVFAVAGLLGLRFLLSTLRHLIGEAEDEVVEREIETSLAARVARQQPQITYDMSSTDIEAATATPPPAEPRVASPVVPVHRSSRSGAVSQVFYIWIGVFGLVGAQMAWVMRPFLGHPGGEFVMVRLRQSNFFEAILKTIAATLGG